ncbi:hypothetical protein HPB50_016649 [Hyalomma asiaticum]|uniref:Uncharacterized protein n=1 Tax=Hyalomma asiaticum TaxID=266040 RepID=A0ACB7TJ62_HYAAI|nr:hypothetical protein HPB50_016649 [Hyalomma asiaticum]
MCPPSRVGARLCVRASSRVGRRGPCWGRKHKLRANSSCAPPRSFFRPLLGLRAEVVCGPAAGAPRNHRDRGREDDSFVAWAVLGPRQQASGDEVSPLLAASPADVSRVQRHEAPRSSAFRRVAPTAASLCPTRLLSSCRQIWTYLRGALGTRGEGPRCAGR